MTEARFKKHISQLLGSLMFGSIACEFRIGPSRHLSQSHCLLPSKTDERQIPIVYVGGLASLRAYYVGLHELGHAVQWWRIKTRQLTTFRKWYVYFMERFHSCGVEFVLNNKAITNPEVQVYFLSSEFDAWEWAIANAKFPLNKTVRSIIRKGIRSYVKRTMLNIFSRNDPCWEKLFACGNKVQHRNLKLGNPYAG